MAQARKRSNQRRLTDDDIAQRIERHNAQFGLPQKDPERAAAHKLVNKAVKLGLLPRPSTKKCITCPLPAQVYHHPNGYTAEHALDVVPMCRPCHGNLHLAPRPLK